MSPRQSSQQIRDKGFQEQVSARRRREDSDGRTYVARRASLVRVKLDKIGEDIQFVPGHGQMSTFGWERKTNSFVADLLFDDDEEAST